MRILFVNHTFPGDLGPLLAAFAAQPGHEVLFASCRGRRDFSVPGVRHVVLSPSRSRRLAGDGAGTALDRAVETGRQALQAFRLLRRSAFVPDMVLLSSALEQGLFLRDVFPETFVACFAESLPSDGLAGDGKGLVRHLLQCRQMLQSDLVIRLAAEAGTRDPEQRGAVILPYPVDTDYFAPLAPSGTTSPGAGARVLCAVRDAADVWPMLRLAEALLAQCPDCRPVLLCESAAGRASLADLGTSLPPGIEVPERLSLQAYRDLLRTAAVITAPAASCLSAPVLLEAMSCGVVPVLADDASRWPLLQEGGGCLWCGAAELVPTLAGILAQPHQLAELSLAARRTVERHFRRQDVIPGQLALLHQARAAWLRKRQDGTAD
ncbi:hypothetical protein [uncultured Desulfovibrio sp.]|uniref:hypothetical protein n=1 Tax=uncultured Desulfovibrio sp. TaxID=167968 RepID=UPI00265D32A8|nr:hypothetical protein [uncultured Desulfovibrio sp.]